MRKQLTSLMPQGKIVGSTAIVHCFCRTLLPYGKESLAWINHICRNWPICHSSHTIPRRISALSGSQIGISKVRRNLFRNVTSDSQSRARYKHSSHSFVKRRKQRYRGTETKGGDLKLRPPLWRMASLAWCIYSNSMQRRRGPRERNRISARHARPTPDAYWETRKYSSCAAPKSWASTTHVTLDKKLVPCHAWRRWPNMWQINRFCWAG